MDPPSGHVVSTHINKPSSDTKGGYSKKFTVKVLQKSSTPSGSADQIEAIPRKRKPLHNKGGDIARDKRRVKKSLSSVKVDTDVDMPDIDVSFDGVQFPPTLNFSSFTPPLMVSSPVVTPNISPVQVFSYIPSDVSKGDGISASLNAFSVPQGLRTSSSSTMVVAPTSSFGVGVPLARITSENPLSGFEAMSKIYNVVVSSIADPYLSQVCGYLVKLLSDSPPNEPTVRDIFSILDPSIHLTLGHLTVFTSLAPLVETFLSRFPNFKVKQLKVFVQKMKSSEHLKSHIRMI
ncbi:hypothetical protein MKX03_006645 [Papaver bracteatum]|nr:hypothetical protein MKX03_006645 [Papaver bracteatum]